MLLFHLVGLALLLALVDGDCTRQVRNANICINVFVSHRLASITNRDADKFELCVVNTFKQCLKKKTKILGVRITGVEEFSRQETERVKQCIMGHVQGSADSTKQCAQRKHPNVELDNYSIGSLIGKYSEDPKYRVLAMVTLLEKSRKSFRCNEMYKCGAAINNKIQSLNAETCRAQKSCRASISKSCLRESQTVGRSVCSCYKQTRARDQARGDYLDNLLLDCLERGGVSIYVPPIWKNLFRTQIRRTVEKMFCKGDPTDLISDLCG